MMKVEGRVERLLLLPFSIGCDSHSSVAVATTVHSPPKHDYSKTSIALSHNACKFCMVLDQ